MAPAYANSRRSLDALDACTGACNLGLIIGCAAPIFIAISTFSILLIRRNIIARRSKVQREEAISNGGSSFGMLYSRLSSIHASRQSQLVEIPQIEAPRTSPETTSFKSLSAIAPANGEEITKEKTESDECQISEESPTTPLLVLPSLSSMLGDFLSYGEAIAEQAQPDPPVATRPDTPCSLKAITFEGEPDETLCIESSQELITVPLKEDSDAHLIAYMAASTSSVKMNAGAAVDVPDGEMHPFAPMAVEDLALYLQSDLEIPPAIQSRPNLAVTTTLWSILVDSNSTLETLLPVRLDDFPSIPQLNPVGVLLPHPAADHPISFSQSSLALTFSKSISAPASINLLDCSMEDIPRRIFYPPRHLSYFPRRYDPGQLWDEEDEHRFSKEVVKGKQLRNTWAAGVSYSRSASSGPGELWDEEDERRMSCNSSVPITDECLEALSTFATLSFASVEMSQSGRLGSFAFEKSFRSVAIIPVAGSTDGDTTIGTSGSSGSTHALLSHKNTDADFTLLSFDSGGLCICQEVFPGSPCVCDSDPGGGATIVELDEAVEPLKHDAQTSFGYQAIGESHNHSHFSLHLDDDDVKSQAAITASPSTARSSLASFAGLIGFDFDTKGKCVIQDQDPVVDMDIEPNSLYLSAVLFIRLPWPWVPLD